MAQRYGLATPRAVVSAGLILLALVVSSCNANAQQHVSGAQAEVIARAEGKQLGLDPNQVTAEWDETNSAWKRMVGDDIAASIEADHGPCGFWAVRLSRPDPGPLIDPPGTIVLRLGGTVFVLVDRCTGSVLATVPVR